MLRPLIIVLSVLATACSGSGGSGAAGTGVGDDGGTAGQPGGTPQNNAPPLAAADVGVQSGGSVTLPVLLNDSDPDGDPLVIAAVTPPLHGTASTADGRVVYSPDAGFLGADSFSYTIDDGRGGSATAYVRISAGLHAPRLTPDSATVAPGASVTIAVLANDIDLSGGALQLTGVVQPVNGSVSVSDNATPTAPGDDAIVYTAPTGFAGTERFSYSAANGAGSAMSEVTVTVSDPAVAAPPVTVSGRAVKGPLQGATVSLYNLDLRGQPQQPALAESVTDEAGRWTAVVTADHGPLLVVTDGGEYADEASSGPGAQVIALQPGEALTGVLPAGEDEAAISVFTDALYRKSLFETQGDNFNAVFAGNRADATAAFGFDPVTTIAADPANPEPGMSDDAMRYALALGGAANVINAMAVVVGLDSANYAIIDAFAADFAECVLNGQGLNGPLQVDVNGIAVNLPTRLDINLAIVRFRNNLADRYGTLLTRIEQATCSRPGFLPDVTAPVFGSAPGAVTVNAQSAAGTPASSLDLATVLNAPQAADDRDGVIAVSNNAPALFPQGTTPVTFVATDAGGNRSELVVPVTVADLAPPRLTVPGDITVPQVGRVTAVALGLASATDNVSPAAGILLFNDAPANGFPPGTTTVTWTAIDEAGLATTGVQQVSVTSDGAPMLLTPLADTASTEDSLLLLDLAAAFDVPGTTAPVYTITGLPAGSGLILDGGSGILRGRPSDADVLAAPLTLVFTADNGKGSASDTFVVSVTNINDAPLIGSAPPTTAVLNTTYTYNVASSDVDPGDRLTVRAPVLPAWLSLTDNLDGTATLTGAPAVGDAGGNAVVLEVTDASGAVATQSFSIYVDGTADVSLSLAVDNATPVPGDIVMFTLTAANAGPNDTDGVLIHAFDATGYHLLTASGDFDFDTFTWNPGPIAAGDSASLIVQAEVKARGNYRARAEVGASLLDDPDSNPANGNVSEDDYAERATTPVGGEPDRDQDGVTDADETGIYLTNPDNADSDGDGVEDRIEILVAGNGTLANTPASVVLYVDHDAAPGGDGSSWNQALSTSSQMISVLPNGTVADPVYVLLSATDNARYEAFTLNRDHVVITGADDSGTPLVPGRMYATIDAQGADNPAVIANGGGEVTLVNLLMTGGQPSSRGGGLRVGGSQDLRVFDSVIAGNDAGDDGGGFWVGSNASLVLVDSQVYSNTAYGMGGGGGFAEGTLTVRNSIIADNIQWSAGGQPGGGGLTLRGNGTSQVRDTMVLSNFSVADGGGLHANQIDGDTLLHNNLVVGNANVDGFGGGLHADAINTGPLLTISSSTFALNQTVVNFGGFTLAGGVDLWTNADNVVVNNNVMWGNDDESGSPDNTDNFIQRGTSSTSHNNIEGFSGAGLNGDIDADPVFLEGFFLHQASSGSVDAGSTTAAAAGLDAPYTTDVAAGGDIGTLDQGFHYAGRSAGIADNVEVVTAYCRDTWTDENVSLIFRPRRGAKPIGPGHKVVVLQTGGPATTLLSVTALRPAGAGSALAADQGDGTYRVLLANAGLSGTVTLSVIVDDVGGGALSQNLAAVAVGSCDVDSGRERFLKRHPWLASPF